MEEVGGHCYCGQLNPVHLVGTFQCKECQKRFHPECLQCPVLSPLRGDTFYNFLCSHCGPHGQEEYQRSKISWLHVVMLTLYNLQLGGGGKCGYFRWKEHVCGFIDKNWTVFFGSQRKKTTLWHGTVAGTLSANCPQKFVSGTRELGEPGWWKLAEMRAPVYSVDTGRSSHRGTRQSSAATVSSTVSVQDVVEGKRARRARPQSVHAAMELKAKRRSVTENKRSRRSGLSPSGSSSHNITDSVADISSHSARSPCDTSPVKHLNTEVIIDSSHITSSLDINPVAHAATKTVDSVSGSMHKRVKQSGSVVSHMRTSCDPTDLVQCESSYLSKSCQSWSDSSHAHLTWNKDSQASLITDHFFTLSTQSNTTLQTSQQHHAAESLTGGMLLGEGEDSEEDFEIDPGTVSLATLDSNRDLSHSPVMEELMCNIKGDVELDVATTASIRQEPSQADITMDWEGPSEDEGGTSEGESSSDGEEGKETVGKTPVPRRQDRKRLQEEEEERAVVQPSLRHMTLYDEMVLLRRLNASGNVIVCEDGETDMAGWTAEQLQHACNRLRRKLIVRKLKRENGLAEFDLDADVTRLAINCWGAPPPVQDIDGLNVYGAPLTRHPHGYVHTLDRFMARLGGAGVSIQHTSFRTRLVGFEDDQLQPITSPYTMRVLKPFICRDMESEPQKLKLLQEIVAYPHRRDPQWIAPASAPIDYCYVRPQHIPSVNMLCSTFFWPGIDLSECLQYPDFSCVVLYKRVVVAFAFLVPDVKHNEAYISFIFTHPEWRGAGIASFMLYHLIQTCMGKDITLHVSATNPAMLLYQKFGFKAEELCLDFYDKYFPVNSRECKHAFFLRLHR